jgi:membrane associated rhomboid family serine protease
MSRPFTWLASAIFALIALVHLYRVFTHFQVIIGSHEIPQWASIVGAVIAAVLSWMLCREARGTTGA